MIHIKEISKTYNKGKKNELVVLNNVSLEIEKGEMLAIMGRSGAGKSTLLHILACIDKLDKGTYELDNVDITNLSEYKTALLRNKNIGIVLQDFAIIPSETAISNVSTPLYFSQTPFLKIKKKALEALETVNMGSYKNQRVSTLSGGEKQRIAIARAIVNDPKILLADEPTGSLDSKTSDAIMEIFRMLNRNGTTIVIVTHDIKIAESCDRIIRIEDGVIFGSDVLNKVK